MCTVAKHSKDAINNPPTFKPNILLPLCNKSTTSLCTEREVKYHGLSYLYMISFALRNGNKRNCKKENLLTQLQTCRCCDL